MKRKSIFWLNENDGRRHLIIQLAVGVSSSTISVEDEDETSNRHGRQSIFGTICLKIAHFFDSFLFIQMYVFLETNKKTSRKPNNQKKYDSLRIEVNCGRCCCRWTQPKNYIFEIRKSFDLNARTHYAIKAIWMPMGSRAKTWKEQNLKITRTDIFVEFLVRCVLG